MINQIPALSTSVIATVRRDNGSAASVAAQQADQQGVRQDQAFRLNPDKAETPVGNNDNFALNGPNIAMLNTGSQPEAVNSKSVFGYANRAYGAADLFSAFAPQRCVNFAI